MNTLRKKNELTALVPALNDLSLANVEAERLASVVGGVKLLSTVEQSTTVVNFNLVTCIEYQLLSQTVSFHVEIHMFLLTGLGLAGALYSGIDLDFKTIVQCRSSDSEEGESTSQTQELHFDKLLFDVML